MEHTVLTPRDVDTFAQLRKVYYQIATVIGSSRFKEDIQKWNAIQHQCVDQCGGSSGDQLAITLQY